ncbi:cyclin-dependent kinase inhibitor 7-like [Humulus lupulus]|uniref:cyclin-dependent kinase inhibitor 7-like n=1 Tax=Humulus lupulus TaxID=3486 RepID=UPI002B414EB9|nr:cyclin-dependent kinase inhibitor 7-like [Humulus lupulus]
MGDCKRNATISMMETSPTALAMASKRRKFISSNQQLRLHSSSTTIDELGNRTLTVNSSPTKLDNVVAISNTGDTTCSIFSKDWSSPLASCCSSNESSDNVVNDSSLRIVDLQDEVVKSFETAHSISINNNRNKFRETTPSSELCGDSEKKEASAASNRRRPPLGMAPPRNEIEEFFAIAEKTEQKRFTEKYNFDVVNDTPLEGRYQWVCLKP